MKALTLPAGRGWYWLSDGFRLFRRGRLMLSLAVLGYWMCMALVNSFPIFGQIVASLLIPAFSVCLMNACRLIEQGSPLQAQTLFSGLRENQRTLLVLGAIYILTGVCVLGIVSLIDGGVLFNAIVLGQRLDESTISSGEFVLAVQAALLLFSPIMMTYLFAPVLVVWHGFTAGKSLFFSFLACARNWRAFLTYAAAIIVYGALLPGLLVGLLVSVIPQGSELFSVLLPMLIMLIFLPTLYASFYVIYRDIFASIDESA
jgi:hypothetical protein